MERINTVVIPLIETSIDSLSEVMIPSVSYTHLRAHETVLDLVCRLLLDKKKYTDKSTVLHMTLTHTYINTQPMRPNTITSL